jgi:hypothetical protein
MVKDRRPGPGMPFLDSDPCAEGGLFISARVFFPDAIHGWMTGRMDGENFTTTTSLMHRCVISTMFGSCFSFKKKLLSFLFLFNFYVFSVFIIILYNKNKVFLFHFCIFVYLDASLKFGGRRHTSFFFR